MDTSASIAPPGKPAPFFQRSDWIAGLLTFLVTLAVYAWTMPPTVTLEDAGELAVAADYLGVPHQPGYPIWSLLAWFFQWIFGFIKFNGQPNPAWGVSLMSACFGAIAAGILAMVMSHSGRRMLDGFGERKPTEKGNFAWMGGALAVTVLVCLFITVTGVPSSLDPAKPTPMGGGQVFLRAIAMGTAAMALLYAGVSVVTGYFLSNRERPEWTSLLIPLGRQSAVFTGGALGLLLYVGLWTGNAQAKWLALGLLAAIPLVEFLLDRFGGPDASSGRTFPAAFVSAATATGACLLFALSPTVWSQSNIVEVYSLNTFFMASVMMATYMWLWHPERDRLLVIGAFLFGLGLTNHQSLIFMLPFMLLVIGTRDIKLALNAMVLVLLLMAAASMGSCWKISGQVAEFKAQLAAMSPFSADYRQLADQVQRLAEKNRTGLLFSLGVSGVVMLGYHLARKGVSVVTLALFYAGASMAFAASPFAEEIGNVQNLESSAGKWVVFTIGLAVMCSPLLFARTAPERFRIWLKLYAVLGAILLGLSFNLYMAFASEQNPPMNWSYARTFQGWMHSIKRGQYEKIEPDKNLARTLHQLNMGEPHRQYYLKTAETSLKGRLRDEQLDARLRYKGERLDAELKRLEDQYQTDLAREGARLYHENKFFFFDQVGAFFYQTANTETTHKFSMVNQYSVAFSLLGLVPFLFVFRTGNLFRHWLGATAVLFLFLSVVFVVFQYPNLDVQDLFIKRVQYIQAYGIYGVWIGYGALALAYLVWRVVPVNALPVGAAAALAVVMPWHELNKDANDDLHLQTLGASNMKGHDFGWQFGYYQLKGGPGIDEELKPGEPPRPDPSYPPAMEPDAIFFGGTDPGRFVPTYMIYSADVRPDVFLITQNALADNTYMNVMRDLYGEQIWIPAQSDTNDSFREYMTKVQTGEIDAGAELSTEGGKVSVSGVQGVMHINAILSRKIFDRNKHKHAFYVEESYPIPWMNPYLTPHGLIMKLNAEPTPVTPDLIRKDFEFWRWYIARLKRQPGFAEDVIAQKTFSKLRSAIAGLYAARGFPRQAEEAFRQALDLYPLSPEAAMRMALVYIQTQRVYDAQVIAERLLASDPGNKTIQDFLRNTSLMKVSDRQRKALESQIRLKGFDAASGMKLAQIYGAMGNTTRLASVTRRLISEPALRLEPRQFMELNSIAEMNKQWRLQRDINTAWSQRQPNNGQPLVELAVVELRELGAKKGAPECFKHLQRAVQLGGDPIRKYILDDTRLDVLRGTAAADKQFQAFIMGGRPAAAPAAAPASPKAPGSSLSTPF